MGLSTARPTLLQVGTQAGSGKSAVAVLLTIMPSPAIIPAQAALMHEHPVNHVCYNSTGRTMATADTDLIVKVWQLDELHKTYDMRRPGDESQSMERVRGIRLNAAGTRLFVAAGEHLASFDLTSESNEPDWVYTAPRMFVFFMVPPIALDLSDGDWLASSFDNGTMMVWDA